MRFEIARSLNGEKLMYVARDTNGIVRLREETLEELQESIVKYNEMQAAQAIERAKVKRGKKSGKEGDESESEGVNSDEEAEETVETQASQTETAAEEFNPLSLAPEPEVEKEQESKKEFLQNDLKEKVEEKKKRTSGKGSFWDKLK